MNAIRARQIASGFVKMDGCEVEEMSGGLLVQYQGKSAYFVCEACFWPFIYRVISRLGRW